MVSKIKILVRRGKSSSLKYSFTSLSESVYICFFKCFSAVISSVITSDNSHATTDRYFIKNFKARGKLLYTPTNTNSTSLLRIKSLWLGLKNVFRSAGEMILIIALCRRLL